MNNRKKCSCKFCQYADKEKMKCNPHSKDCRSNYDLEAADFVELKICDYYKPTNKGIE